MDEGPPVESSVEIDGNRESTNFCRKIEHFRGNGGESWRYVVVWMSMLKIKTKIMY